jgi:hypothetical protein
METMQQAVVIGGTGDGRMKTMAAETPIGSPDVSVTFIPTAIALIARASSAFFTVLGGQLGAGAIGVIGVQTWKDAVLIAASAAAVNLVFSLGTVSSNLEKKFPIVSQLT